VLEKVSLVACVISNVAEVLFRTPFRPEPDPTNAKVFGVSVVHTALQEPWRRVVVK
jgi:hypothetical protein